MSDEDTPQPLTPSEPAQPVSEQVAPEAAPVETPPAETQTAQVPVNEPFIYHSLSESFLLTRPRISDTMLLTYAPISTFHKNA